MTETAVIEKPVEATPPSTFTPPVYEKGDMTFGFDESKPTAQRDERGRFVKAEDKPDEATPPVEEVVATPDVVETPVVVETKPTEETVPSGLGVEDEAPPTFGHDGKFFGGKFLGKYDTIDDAMQGHKNALKRIGQLENEMNVLASSGPDVGPPYHDVDSLTQEQMAEKVAAEIGAKDEMSYEDRVAYEENPARYIANLLVKGKQAMEKVTTEMSRYNSEWEANTRAAYPKLYDQAIPLGKKVWADLRSGKVKLPELQVLLGAGIMAREGMLSDKEPITRVKPVGRASEVRASVPVPVVPRKGPSEEAAYLADMQKARYG